MTPDPGSDRTPTESECGAPYPYIVSLACELPAGHPGSHHHEQRSPYYNATTVYRWTDEVPPDDWPAEPYENPPPQPWRSE